MPNQKLKKNEEENKEPESGWFCIGANQTKVGICGFFNLFGL
jgi:hypothetical protein